MLFLWHWGGKKKDTFVFVCTEKAGGRERESRTACFGGGVGFSAVSRSWTIKAALGSRTSPLFPKSLFARYSGMPIFWQRIKNFSPDL